MSKSKATIIVDTPENCYYCKFNDYNYSYGGTCTIDDKPSSQMLAFEEEHNKRKDCPLIEIK